MIGPGWAIVRNNMNRCVPKLYGFHQLILLEYPIISKIPFWYEHFCRVTVIDLLLASSIQLFDNFLFISSLLIVWLGPWRDMGQVLKFNSSRQHRRANTTAKRDPNVTSLWTGKRLKNGIDILKYRVFIFNYSLAYVVVPNTEEQFSQPFLGLSKIWQLFQDPIII